MQISALQDAHHDGVPGQRDWMRSVCAAVLSLLMVFEPFSIAAPQTLPEPAASTLQPTPYEREASKQRKRRTNSNLPSPDVAERMLNFDKDAFTDEAWEGMKG